MTMPVNDPGADVGLPAATHLDYQTQPPLPPAPVPFGLEDKPEIPEVRWS